MYDWKISILPSSTWFPNQDPIKILIFTIFLLNLS